MCILFRVGRGLDRQLDHEALLMDEFTDELIAEWTMRQRGLRGGSKSLRLCLLGVYTVPSPFLSLWLSPCPLHSGCSELSRFPPTMVFLPYHRPEKNGASWPWTETSEAVKINLSSLKSLCLGILSE